MTAAARASFFCMPWEKSVTSFLVLVGQLHEFEQLLGAQVGGLLVQAVHAADEAQILGRGEAAEQRHAFGHDADLALQLEGRCAEGLAENLDGAGAGLEQAGEHLDGGGFARSVGPQEAEELSGRHAEGDIVHGGQRAEAPGEAMGLNRSSFHVRQG